MKWDEAYGRVGRWWWAAGAGVFSVLMWGAAWLTRVQVILPAFPEADRYEWMTVVARTEQWQIDRGFQGEVWLWSDGPYVRPSHLAFTRLDEGIIRSPVVLNLPGLWRIEAYLMTGFLHTWSNPVVVVPPEYPGPRLFFGKLEDCEEPGLDFCISTSPPHSAPLRPSPSPARPALLPALQKSFGDETWIILPSPPAAAELTPKISTADRSQLLRLLSENPDRFVVFLSSGGRGELPHLSPSLAPVLLLDPPSPSDSPSPELAALTAGLPRKPSLVLPDRRALIAVWAKESSGHGLWRGLKNLTFYSSWNCRMIVDWSGKTARFFPASASGSFLLAGNGPRLEVSVYAWTGNRLAQILSRQTEDFYLLLDPRELSAASGDLFLHVSSPGHPRAARALAGPLRYAF